LAKKKKILSLPDKMIKFIETLKQPTGDGVGRPMKLMDFQKEMIREVYGPIDKSGNRIVHEAVLTLARKNLKTTTCAAIGLCHLWLPELMKVNQDIIILAWTREQANNLFKSMAEMILLDEELIHDFTISTSRKYLVHKESGGTARVESAEAASLHGANPSVVMLDEAGNWPAEKAREIYSVVTTGFGARKESLVWLLSTQSPTDNHLFSEKVDYGKMVNSKEIEDPAFKAFIYEIPEGMDCFDEKNWVLANPAIDVLRSREEMQKKAKEAKQLPSMANSFLQLFCNQRVDSYSPFISKSVWTKNNKTVDISKLKGRTCYGGVDLSAKTDLTSLCLVFPTDDEVPKFDVISFNWKPFDLLREQSVRDRVPYQTWHNQGWISTTPGTSISYEFVAHKLYELSQLYDIKFIAFDRWRAVDLRNSLDAIGCAIPLVEFGQGFQSMGPACDYFEEVLLDERVRAGSNPVLTWAVSNTVVISDPAGSRKFCKAKSFGRIDSVIALAMALRIYQLKKNETTKSLYDDLEFVAYLQG